MDQLNKLIIVSRYTFKEMLKGKILWNVVVIGFVLALLTFVATQFTFGAPARIALDLGLASLSIASYFIAILIGINLIKKEEESRTIYLIVSRPVARSSFLIGKILGVCAFLALNIFLLSLITLLVVMLLGGEISSVAIWSMVFSTLESMLLLCVVVLLAMIANQALALMGAILLLLSGHAIGETANILYVQLRPWLKTIVEIYQYFLPGFYHFNIKDLALYQQALPLSQVAYVFGYWGFYTATIVGISVLVLNRKNLD